MTALVRQRHAMRLIGRSYMAFVLAPEGPVPDWVAELDGWLARSRGFFANRPVVLDLTDAPTRHGEIVALVRSLEERGIRVLGLEGAASAQCGHDLPPVLSGGRAGKMLETVREE